MHCGLLKVKEANLRIFLTWMGLACAAALLMVSHAERQQEASMDKLSSFRLEPQPVLYDDPDLKQVTAHSPHMRNER